jgi:hypothetical protein
LGKTQSIITFCDNSVILHSSFSPLVLTFVLKTDGNVGVVNALMPEIFSALRPLQEAVAEN